MAVVRFIVLALVSLVFPGAGHAALGARRHGALWCGVGLLAMFAIAGSLWALPMSAAIRVACVIDLVRAAKAREREGEGIDWIGGGGVVGLSAVAIVGAFSTVFGVYRVPSGSMEPAIARGDVVVVSRLSHTVVRGEVATFDHPCEHVPYVKRVIALGGEAVEVRCSAVYVDGVRVDGTPNPKDTADDFPVVVIGGNAVLPSCPGVAPVGKLKLLKGDAMVVADPCKPRLAYVVPMGTVFVLGDNQDRSFDSRAWGTVPVATITGRALGVAWPLSHLSDL